jgi:hypothetical protein
MPFEPFEAIDREAVESHKLERTIQHASGCSYRR